MNKEYMAEWKEVLTLQNNIAIKCSSSEEKLFALQLYATITGFPISNLVLEATVTDSESVREFPFVGLGGLGGTPPVVSGFCREDRFFTIYTLDEFKNALKSRPTVELFPCIVEKVVLNDSYTAEVSKRGIKVGCQTSRLDTAASLVTAIDKILGTPEKKTVPEKVVNNKSKKTYHADNLPVITFVYGASSNETRTVKVLETNSNHVMGLEVLSSGKHHYKKFFRCKMYYTHFVSFNPNTHKPVDKD